MIIDDRVPCSRMVLSRRRHVLTLETSHGYRPVFEYFPAHYSWNLGLLMAAQLGGEMSEIDEACRPLRDLAAERERQGQSRRAGGVGRALGRAG